ncbi:MAG: hypothetical protein KF773_42205 [Deltaproteobacteria bacterium]|nr:hypothetical protein [Deltaproteobacteria bacterium]MCW5805042.1 hypothetical protein [Deltaproteobacteria bacterium]
MNMRPSSLGAFLVACVAIGFGMSGAQPDPTAAGAGVRFDHAKHETDVKKLKKDLKCEGCHGLDKAGKIIAPASQGHHPCIESGCHSDLFLAAGKAAEAKPVEFRKRQTAVCTVCHTGVPAPWQKAKTKVLRAFESQIDHHVEMPHYSHTQMNLPKDQGGKQVECRTCHVVNAKGTDSRIGREYGLAYNAPGHAECVLCHNPQANKDHTMSQCGSCHKNGSRADYYGPPRPGTKVRACDSEGLEILKKSIANGEVVLRHPGTGIKANCFKHETKAHRWKDHKEADPKQPVQCNACHAIVEQKNAKGEPLFETLRDMKGKSLIDHDEAKQHARCGAAGCHANQVGNGAMDPKCGYCHPEVSGF